MYKNCVHKIGNQIWLHVHLEFTITTSLYTRSIWIYAQQISFKKAAFRWRRNMAVVNSSRLSAEYAQSFLCRDELQQFYHIIFTLLIPTLHTTTKVKLLLHAGQIMIEHKFLRKFACNLIFININLSAKILIQPALPKRQQFKLSPNQFLCISFSCWLKFIFLRTFSLLMQFILLHMLIRL